ncbi:hypothetical protein IB642_00255 [Allofrancisella guangzhouensis]|uniref:Cell division protein ZipA n=1 Tax=Allofrancisella guangzhouensis TaxID=594679 RepID=A0A0A8E6G0_9GAMM|nr:cell division protein ZipA C-terminal FtsZ-binding domain-containing protein [Allofrancisella guangzhouensis]AJC49539.1 membrane protein [Allofrancisella guangzhouensis]MBK2027366.1 hypothetical protein [Allofrancisella guangzhouensis]MBK2043449.1 hypothetical protein [Allofrancisella guangzhouensis]MBK2045218.1 hypothetical protein [Allofrancisella guangzhouensis]
MSLILVLVLILVVLIIVDFFRKSLRLKQKMTLENIEKKSSELLANQLKNNFSDDIVEIQLEYPLLREGYLLLYFESIEPIEIKKLATQLKYCDLRYTGDKVFQKIDHGDVIFSILPDDEKQEFESVNEGSVNGIIAVMNFKKLSALGYDIKTCYELMMDILETLNKTYNGTLMNEHRVRLTKKDRQSFLEVII